MRRFFTTFLVILVMLGIVTTPVRAGDILEPGDIAIIGYRFGSNAEFSFVCLRVISEGTEIKFTDNGWKENQTFRTGEGFLGWIAPSGGCELGQIVKVVIANYDTGMNLEIAGDQIIAFQGYPQLDPNLIFAVNSYGYGWQSTAINNQTSSLPTILANLNPSPSIALGQTAYAIYSDNKRAFNSTTEALAYLTNSAHWTVSSTALQMPTGNFSFTTTAVHLSEFSAETGGESAPWWVLLGLVVVPVAVMVLRRPKRDCCER